MNGSFQTTDTNSKGLESTLSPLLGIFDKKIGALEKSVFINFKKQIKDIFYEILLIEYKKIKTFFMKN